MTTTMAGCASRTKVSSAPATTRVSSGQSKKNRISFAHGVQVGGGHYVGEGGVVVSPSVVNVVSDDGLSAARIDCGQTNLGAKR